MAGRRILVVGAGFAGLYAAMGMKNLVRAGHRVTVVNDQNFMQYQPFLPEVASGTIDPRAVVVPLRPVLRHCEIVIGDVERLEHEQRRAHIRLPDGSERVDPYDVVVLAPGSRSNVLPIPGLGEHGIGFKTVQEAIFLRNRVLSRLDVAAGTEDESVRRAALTFVFVGGGYAGVEALGELEDLARDALEAYPRLGPGAMRWILLDVAPAILPELGPDLARYASQELAERGIEIAVRTGLVSYEAGVATTTDGREIPAHTLVWTAGVRPSPLAARSGFPVDERGRLRTDRFLRVVGVEDAWAAGDAAAIPDRATSDVMPPTATWRRGRRRRRCWRGSGRRCCAWNA